MINMTTWNEASAEAKDRTLCRIVGDLGLQGVALVTSDPRTPASPMMTLRILPRGKGKVKDIPVDTLNQASAIWDRMRMEKGWRYQTAPKGVIFVEGQPRAVAWVSFNGKIWEGTEPSADQYVSGRTPIFDPCLRQP